jgi:glutamate-1-semialdehyde 2,1-aminomutase
VTEGVAKDTLVLEFNDIGRLEAAFAQRGGDIAAVIIEPVVGNMGCVPPAEGYLQAVRDLTTRHGALLIFDEVITGFRVAHGGAQALYGVSPDLTTLGKIVGGGFPLGAYGGRAEIMRHVLPDGKVFQAGTLSGNPVATAAGIATLQVLRDERPYGELERRAQRLADGLSQAAAAARIPACVQRVGSMLTLFFHAGPVGDWTDASRCDRQRFGRYFWALLDRGVYMPCSQFEALFISTAHSDADLDVTIDAALDAVKA